MRSRTEDPPERGGVRVGSDAETEAADASTPCLDERSPGVGLAVATFVAVVVREAIGHDDEQPSWSASALFDHAGGVPDGGAESRVRRRHEAIETADDMAVQSIVEVLDPQELHGSSPSGVEGEERNAIAELVQGNREGGGRRPLVLVYTLACSARFSRRPRDIEQHEHREVTSPAQARDVEVVLVRRTGHAVDPRFDGGVDIDVIALRLPPAR